MGGEISLECFETYAATSDDILLHIVVRDNGIGIEKEFLPHIFDKFARSVDTRVSEVRGSGLGLSIVKDLVDMMHGTVDIASEVGHGTTVTVCIPFPCSKPNAGSAPMPCDGLHILIAEDNELSYEVASELLGMTAFRPNARKTARSVSSAFCPRRPAPLTLS